jgi:hypothetical protein
LLPSLLPYAATARIIVRITSFFGIKIHLDRMGLFLEIASKSPSTTALGYRGV